MFFLYFDETPGRRGCLKCLISGQMWAWILKQTCSYQFLRFFFLYMTPWEGVVTLAQLSEDQISVQTFLQMFLCACPAVPWGSELSAVLSEKWWKDILTPQWPPAHRPRPHNIVVSGTLLLNFISRGSLLYFVSDKTEISWLKSHINAYGA